ncbi:MAG: hypothetical protein WCI51_17260 [Lentisphaerota bacterium]
MKKKDMRLIHYYFVLQFDGHEEQIMFDIPKEEFDRLESRLLNVSYSEELIGFETTKNTRAYINPNKIVFSQLLYDVGYVIQDEEDEDEETPKDYLLTVLLSGIKESKTICTYDTEQLGEIDEYLMMEESFYDLEDQKNQFIGIIDEDDEYFYFNRKHVLYFEIPIIEKSESEESISNEVSKEPKTLRKKKATEKKNNQKKPSLSKRKSSIKKV